MSTKKNENMTTTTKTTDDTNTNGRSAWLSASAEFATAESDLTRLRGEVRKRSRNQSPQGRNEDRLLIIAAELRMLEAEEAVNGTTTVAGAALDAVEIEQGDALAISRDRANLLADLTSGWAKVEKLRADLRAAIDACTARLATAQQAETKLIERRQSQSLPLPVRLPRPPQDFGMSAEDARLNPERMMAALREPPEVVSKNADKIARLRSEEVQIRADLQFAHEEEARQKQHEAETKRLQDEEYRRRSAATAARNRAEAAQGAAHSNEKNRLADAHRARTAKGAA